MDVVANELVLLTAGNLATSQAVVAQLHRDLADDNEMNIAKARYVSEVAKSPFVPWTQLAGSPTQNDLAAIEQGLFSAAK